MTELVAAWLYRARPDRQDAFERVYGPDGTWVRLFGESDDYLGSELWRDGERYLVLDRWRSPEAYERFLEARRDAYDRLSAETQPLYLEETRLGTFGRVPVPDHAPEA